MPHVNRRTRLRLAVTFTFVLACVRSPGLTTATVPPVGGADPFAVAVQAVLGELVWRDTAPGVQIARNRLPLSVDPRPLRADSTVSWVDATTRAAVTPAELSARVGVLHALGLQPGDAAIPPNCGGSMLPFSPTSYHSGCPTSGRRDFAVSLPWPEWLDSTTERNGAPGRWRSRVIYMSVGPHGVTSEVLDVVMERTGGSWRAIDVVWRAVYE
jgi:hypothetical protein